jgi:dTDP-4-dehydrorhamnose 3,5-epimerase
MTLNLIVPSGSVKFVFFDKTFKKLTSLVIGDENYSRITVPPGIWFGFMGVGPGLNLILNIADIEHDPNEVERMSQSELNFDWSEV